MEPGRNRRITRLAACLAASLALAGPGAAQDDPRRVEILSFQELKGWDKDNHQAALDAFLNTCADLKDNEWQSICAVAKSGPGAKTFFELFFRPVLIEDGKPALFTGYYEPELRGSAYPSSVYRYPVYRTPPELAGGLFWSRRQIDESDALKNRGLEIAWVDDPVDLYYLQIQGSGRIRMTDGSVIRVGYHSENGHPNRSIAEELIRRGVMSRHEASAAAIRRWVQRNPVAGRELIWTNPSYVFFRKLPNLAADRGPLGAMNRSVTPLRTLAVDPKFIPLGAPVWLEKGGRNKFHALMVAQDTGSAIKGAQRADIFFGSGFEAGKSASQIKDPGRMIMLLPIQTAFTLAPDGGG